MMMMTIGAFDNVTLILPPPQLLEMDDDYVEGDNNDIVVADFDDEDCSLR